MITILTSAQAFRQAMGRADMNSVKAERMRIMSDATYSRKIRDPSKLTVRELQMFDRVAHFTDEELHALVRN